MEDYEIHFYGAGEEHHVIETNQSPQFTYGTLRAHDGGQIVAEIDRQNFWRVIGADSIAFTDVVICVKGERPRTRDAHGTLNPGYKEGNARFSIAIHGHDPHDTADGGIWTHKLMLWDNKYFDSDRLPITSIVAGASWEDAYSRAGEVMAQAARTDRCIF